MTPQKFIALAAAALITGLSFTQAAQAGPRLDKILETKVIRVGTPGDYRPFAMKTDAGLEGHDIDVMESMAKEMGLKIEYVQTSWPNLSKDMQADKFDVALGGITRNVNRIRLFEMLPGYTASGKVALVRMADKAKYTSLESINKPTVRVIKNPGGTNEIFVLANLKAAQVTTHEMNAEIPYLIAQGKGDVMITETYEALHYAKVDPRLYAAFIDEPLTPKNYPGFMLPKDDADYTRVMNFVWGLMESRGVIKQAGEKWLK